MVGVKVRVMGLGVELGFRGRLGSGGKGEGER